MKVANSTIQALCQLGVVNITYLSAPTEQAYKVYKFKKELTKANAAIDEQKSDIVKNSLPEDELLKAQAYEREKSAAKGGDDFNAKECTAEEYKELMKKFTGHANPLLEGLYKDETELDLKLVPFETYFALKQENNKGEKPLLPDALDEVLAGILWDDPDKAKEEKKKEEKAVEETPAE